MKNDILNDNDAVSSATTNPNTAPITTSNTPQESIDNDQLLKNKIDTSQRQGKKIWIILALVSTLILGTVAAWFFLVYQSSNEDSSENEELAAATKFNSVNELVGEVKPNLKGTVMEVDSYNGVSAVNTNGVIVFSAPAYKLNDKAFIVLPAEADGVGYVGDSINVSANYAVLKRFFEDNKFKRVSEIKEGEAPVSSLEKGNLIAFGVYESREMICAIRHVDATATVLKNHTSYVGCAERQSYVEAAISLQPFYDSYMADGGKVSAIAFGGLVTEKGTDGHERAFVYIENPEVFDEGEENMNYSVNALFYKKPGDSTWKYFTSLDTHPSQLFCSRYDTVSDAKKAFAGFACYDDKAQKESVVG